ncbi:MAG: DUF2812 domain-containing protein [Sphaerochaeta sp.]|jgi:hypothetical protein
MKTRVKKTFLDINKEEEWLNQQGENGLMLIGYNHGEYEFEDVSPAKYQYKIDIPGFSGSKKKDYFDFLKESGISVAGEYGGRVYLRKNRSHGPLELYTGSVDISKQAKKRYTHFLSVGISQVTFGVVLLAQLFGYAKGNPTATWISVIFGSMLTVSGMVFLVKGACGLKRHAPAKEKPRIWEEERS